MAWTREERDEWIKTTPEFYLTNLRENVLKSIDDMRELERYLLRQENRFGPDSDLQEGDKDSLRESIEDFFNNHIADLIDSYDRMVEMTEFITENRGLMKVSSIQLNREWLSKDYR